MAGHSKWANIKHRKAASDAKKGKIYTKLAKEIESAARQGGSDLDYNFALRLAVDKAKAANMPNDNIERAVKRGTGELQGAALEELYYEGYGPNGTALMLKCLTDNRNRTVGDIRSTLKKAGGSLAESGAVAWQFDNKGLITVPHKGGDPDELMMMAIEAGAEDLAIEDELVEFTTARESLQSVTEALNGLGLKAESADLVMVPQHYVTLSVEDQVKVMKMIGQLEELEDVQEIFSNVDFSDEAVALAVP